jgi:hypothetical protein
MRSTIVALTLGVVVGCATLRGSATPTLPGGYRFVALNGQELPVEYPKGSGARLESGTLDLTDSGSFALKFAARSPGRRARETGESGRYRVSSDTLYFEAQGRRRTAVWFRYALDSDGLRLTDRRGDEWAYRRR